ncbi:hypothetical protein ACS0TY_025972 [Phlomoides rotata]
MESGEAGFKFDRCHVKGLLLDLLVVESDTSVASTEWTQSELIRHPEIMNKLSERIRIGCGNGPYCGGIASRQTPIHELCAQRSMLPTDMDMSEHFDVLIARANHPMVIPTYLSVNGDVIRHPTLMAGP